MPRAATATAAACVSGRAAASSAGMWPFSRSPPGSRTDTASAVLRAAPGSTSAAMRSSMKRDGVSIRPSSENANASAVVPGRAAENTVARSRSVTTPIASAATAGPPFGRIGATNHATGRRSSPGALCDSSTSGNGRTNCGAPSIARSSRCRNAPERRRWPQRCGSRDASTSPLRSTMRKPTTPCVESIDCRWRDSSSASAVHLPATMPVGLLIASAASRAALAMTSGSLARRSASARCSPTQTSSPLTTVPSSASRLVRRVSAIDRCTPWYAQ